MFKFDYKEFLESIVVKIDSREKENKNFHIKNYLEYNNIKFDEKTTMKSGDYGFTYKAISQPIIIERKNSLNELSGNLATKDKKERFYREFERIPNCEKYLFIENDNIDNLMSGSYGTKYHPSSFLSNFMLLQTRFNIKIIFVNKYNFGELMIKTFFIYIREIEKTHYLIKEEQEKNKEKPSFQQQNML